MRHKLSSAMSCPGAAGKLQLAGWMTCVQHLGLPKVRWHTAPVPDKACACWLHSLPCVLVQKQSQVRVPASSWATVLAWARAARLQRSSRSTG